MDRPKRDPSKHAVPPTATLRDVVSTIDRGRLGIALVLDEQGNLVDTVTDGDIRRAVLAGLSLDEPVSCLASRRVGTVYGEPITAPVELAADEIASLMTNRSVRHVPLVDSEGRVVDLVVNEDLIPSGELPLDAVVMAGGFGKRLGKLTSDIPKPMLPLGEKPLLEHTIAALRDAGIRRFHVTTHYLADVIKNHFSDGSHLGVDISYVDEDQPLGTAGALGLLPEVPGPVLLLNGDIVTRVDYRAMLEFHREHQAVLTVGVRQYEMQVPYGVVEAQGAVVRAVREKPTASFLVNAGVYLIEPLVLTRVAPNQRLDMPDLIQELLKAGELVVSFPILEYWLDVGRLSDYMRAQEDYENGKAED